MEQEMESSTTKIQLIALASSHALATREGAAKR